MKKSILGFLCFLSIINLNAQPSLVQADSLKNIGLIMPALEKFGMAYAQDPSAQIAYKIASTCALLWTSQMRDTAFYFLNHALQADSTLTVLHDPDFLSLVDDSRWQAIEETQIARYERQHAPIKNKVFAKALFRMIIKDQGFMYVGNLERNKYIRNGGYFSTPAIFPILAMEENNVAKNIKNLIHLLDIYGWPTTSTVTEIAAAGAALIINHSSYEIRSTYFPMLKEAFENGEAQPLRFAKMQDRLLVEEGKKQLYGTQINFTNLKKVPYPIEEEALVDKRRQEIGLGPLSQYLKIKFGIDWHIPQKR